MRKLILLFLFSVPVWSACAGLFTGTPCTATVGTSGRNYATVQACVDAIPANLVTDGNSYVCSLYNDSEFTAGFTVATKTTDSTHTITITAAAGQSFQDHADVRTNPLRYDQTKGVGIRISADYTNVITTTVGYITISRLQVKNSIASPSGANVGVTIGDGAGMVLRDCLVDTNGANGSYYAVSVMAGSGTVTAVNVVAIQRGTGGGMRFGPGTVVGSTIIKPSDVAASATGLAPNGSPTAQGNAIFGFATASSGAFNAASGYNATNLASGLPGTTGNVYNVTYNQTTPFTDAAKASLDLRAAAATALAGAGYKDATNAPNDISGTARAASPTIGAWELAAAPATTSRRRVLP